MSGQQFPNQIKAGTTFKFSLNLTAYPASNWTIHAYLRGAHAIDMQSEPQGNIHIFNISALETKEYKAGHYGYSLRAVHVESGEVDELEAGTVEIKTDLANESVTQDFRSHARRTLDAIEATIEGRASLDQERYRINNRELYRTSFEALKKLRDQYRAEVNREEAKASGKSLFGKTLRVRLG
ncbi:hypothetical protein A6M14_09610 [Acinetobacter sp. Ac_877]|uniref:hypothetical protein n=1 Tax=Acinetobacter portensis TaxID=1839785 RepID=UPI00128BD713|nr:hypothetical protein [Acinetobacter portensis]MPW41724.1 hypothetical protein [Acinetobacter portensis]